MTQQQIVDVTKDLAVEPIFRSPDQLYAFRRPLEVAEFLDAHPFLGPLLVEAHSKIEKHFGPSTVILEVVTDPEGDDDRELFALIQTHLSPDDALNRLEHFDQEWWLDASSRAHCLLNIDVEYT